VPSQASACTTGHHLFASTTEHGSAVSVPEDMMMMSMTMTIILRVLPFPGINLFYKRCLFYSHQRLTLTLGAAWRIPNLSTSWPRSVLGYCTWPPFPHFSPTPLKHIISLRYLDFRGIDNGVLHICDGINLSDSPLIEPYSPTKKI
jgi:hypothetical protein